jgi:hypothetical protein
MSDNYQTENPPLEPTVALAVNSGSFEFTVSYVVDYTKRAAMQDRLFTKIAEEVTDSNGRFKWASSAITVISHPATPGPDRSAPDIVEPRRGRSGGFRKS